MSYEPMPEFSNHDDNTDYKRYVEEPDRIFRSGGKPDVDALSGRSDASDDSVVSAPIFVGTRLPELLAEAPDPNVTAVECFYPDINKMIEGYLCKRGKNQSKKTKLSELKELINTGNLIHLMKRVEELLVDSEFISATGNSEANTIVSLLKVKIDGESAEFVNQNTERRSEDRALVNDRLFELSDDLKPIMQEMQHYADGPDWMRSAHKRAVVKAIYCAVLAKKYTEAFQKIEVALIDSAFTKITLRKQSKAVELLVRLKAKIRHKVAGIGREAFDAIVNQMRKYVAEFSPFRSSFKKQHIQQLLNYMDKNEYQVVWALANKLLTDPNFTRKHYGRSKAECLLNSFCQIGLRCGIFKAGNLSPPSVEFDEKYCMADYF